jgi:NTP pyrophosphatase (non-canonical NTP hydrolase)
MTFDEYQKLARTTDHYQGKADSLHYGVLGLGSEAGEVAGKLKKIMRDEGGVINEEKKDDLKKELGDCLWYLAKVASDLGFSFDTIAQANIEKLADRNKRGVIGGSGDNR